MEAADAQPEQELSEGVKYLRMLGLGHLVGSTMQARGETVPVENFLEICGEHARPAFVGFASLTPEDPRYEPSRTLLRSMVEQYVNPEPEGHTQQS